VLLVIYVLLAICITLSSVYLVLDWLLQRPEEGRLKPRPRQRRILARACQRLWRRGVRKANDVILKRAPRR